MAKKKNFGKGINALFSESQDRIDNAIKPGSRKVKTETNKHATSGHVHKLTCNLDYELYEKIKAISHSARVPLTSIITKSVCEFLSNLSSDEIEEAVQTYRKGENKFGL